jgi:hypothetical protein
MGRPDVAAVQHKSNGERSALVLVPSGSSPLFAGTRRAERRASTAVVDGRLPLCLEMREQRDYHRESLLRGV